MQNKETRTRSIFACELRAEQDEQHGNFITGRPIVFNSRSDMGGFDEVIEAGALDKTDLRDVKFFVNHNIDGIPLARSRNNNANSTMQLIPNLNGMDIRVNLDTENNAEAKSLYSAVQRGDITGMSFMFGIDGEEWEGLDSSRATRRITSISKVFEVSAVNFPAYEDTEIQARSKDALESARKALESAKRSKDTSEIELYKIKNHILGGL